MYVLEVVLKLWHPFMPFVTEAIWRECRFQISDLRMLMVENWPEIKTKTQTKTEIEDFEIIKNTITGIRSLRADYKIDPVKKLKVIVSAGKKQKLLEENAEVIKGLARLEEIEIKIKTEDRKSVV